MLLKLYIRHFAIIQELEVSFGPKLNIITGETGAGKSILMDALSLLLGERADASSLPANKTKCIIEGTFSATDHKVKSLLQQWEVDEGTEMVIRRELLAGGKSRGFINDTPVNLSMMKELGGLLVDQHQQFDGQGMTSESFQRSVVDAIADNAKLLQQLQGVFKKLTEMRTLYNQLLQEQKDAEKERDYHSFLLEELEGLNLKERELEELDEELKTLSNAENIQSVLLAVSSMLNDGEQPLVQQLKIINNQLQQIESVYPASENIRNRIKSVHIELEDIAGDIERLSDTVTHQPERMEWINERLSVGYRLLKKHGVQSTEQLITIREDLTTKLDKLQHTSGTLDKLKLEMDALEKDALIVATEISERRKKCIDALMKNVNTLLKRVGMPNARLKVAIEPGTLQEHGTDSVKFLFNANVGSKETEVAYEVLGKVASGGELSRLMLSIKSLVAGKLQLPTLVFDEIDTGISGEAAKQVALVMEEMSASHQLIAITHQPQIAAKAQSHYYVFKQMKENTVEANIRLLTPEERVTIIAQMLSGEKPSAAAIENAKEMMSVM